MPYIAPEVLRGKPYTKAADIYSLGIIMWEMTLGVPAFHNIPHDFDLSLNICEGTRPKIIEGIMPEYVELMKRCWDNVPEKKPTANELAIIFRQWDVKYQLKEMKQKEYLFLNEPEIKCHPKSCYTSRKFDDSAKLNDIYEPSNKILVDNNDSHDETGEIEHI
ncbi:hypothetical protein RclHR1_01240016 [Rhizophagus clarus]|uniref:Kinase-like domain-containing protein n=1 Tax=Rhizophagus clarus TaxID=94130 RepID=A0A2Z6Q8T7_9GLOM|nr:hypothetical protein RclHR1_01240016 [Rhizophagus clarus]GES97206.1 kinase-like domain-containing protein [Rhizophagus clarus]